MFDIVTIGHFVIDLITSPRITHPKLTLGGPAAFTSIAANRMGAKTSVVSKVGTDFKPYIPNLRKYKIDISMVQTLSKATTHFKIMYHNSKRELQLQKKAPSILPKDIPDSLKSKSIHVAPVANEISNEVVRKARSKTQLISIDPQGFLRDFSAMGNVKLRKPASLDFLKHADFYKSTIQEINLISGTTNLVSSMKKIRGFGPQFVLTTMGKKGAAVHFDEKFFHISACKSKKFKDPTGAGDVFIGAFLAEYIKGRAPLWCCCIGSAAASFVVEEIGAQHFGEKAEICERATKIYEKGIKPLSHNITI